MERTSHNIQNHRCLLGWEGTYTLADICHLPALTHTAELLGLSLQTLENGGRPADITVVQAGAVYLLSAGKVRLSIPVTHNLTPFLSAIIPWTFFKSSPYPVLHASSCVVNDGAVLFCGGSLTGKSSLAVIAWESGFTIVNDDCTAIEPFNARVRPFPQGVSLRLQKPAVQKPFASALGENGPFVLGKGWKSDYWVIFGRSIKGVAPYGNSFPVKALYFLRRGALTRRMPVDRSVALKKILTLTFETQNRRMGNLPLVETLLRRNKVFELEVAEGGLSRAFSLAISPFV